MSALAISLLVFVAAIGGALGGMLLRAKLPREHLSDASQSVVQHGIALVATMAALVLGLLIASGNSSYNSARAQISQLTAQIILLDRMLAEYGPETMAIREGLREAIGPFVTRLWREESSGVEKAGPFVASSGAEALYGHIRTLAPANDLQRSLQERALATVEQLAQIRLLLFAQSASSLPDPFVGILAFWLVVIFFSFGLPAPPNLTTFSVLLICALSASAAIFLILEMSDPFTGLMMIPSGPLRGALPPLSG
jgi:hypothetical protein